MLRHRGLGKAQLSGQVHYPGLAAGQAPHDRQPGGISQGPEQRRCRAQARPDGLSITRKHRHITMIAGTMNDCRAPWSEPSTKMVRWRGCERRSPRVVWQLIPSTLLPVAVVDVPARGAAAGIETPPGRDWLRG